MYIEKSFNTISIWVMVRGGGMQRPSLWIMSGENCPWTGGLNKINCIIGQIWLIVNWLFR